MSAIPLDPLVAEAKERARRRRLVLALVAAGLIALGAAAVALTTPQRPHGSSVPLGSPGSSLDVCARTPAGWRKRTWQDGMGPRITGLTNFRFGPIGDFDASGFLAYAHRPASSVTITLDDMSPVGADPRFKHSLRVTRRDFSVDPYGAMSWPSAYIATHMQGVERTAVVVVGAVTPATIAAANHALAGVRTCSA